MPSRWDSATCGWRRRVFHYPPPTLMSKNFRLPCAIELQPLSLTLLKMRKVELGRWERAWGIRRRDAADEFTEVPNEALVDAARRHPVSAVVVYDLAGQLGVFVLGHGPGKGVHVDHELVAVPVLLLASLDVDDEDTVVVEDEQVRLAGEGGGVSA